jgi:superfamily II DNA or RNA helicase
MNDSVPNSAQWAWSTGHGTVVQVLEVVSLWGQGVARVFVPQWDQVATLPLESIRPLSGTGRQEHCTAASYLAAAARIADTLTQDVLLAPIEASIIPLPHQLRALSRVVAGDRVRYLLADEVGLGKTIEAGLVIRELKLRGLVRRVLVVAPKGLVTQWVSEMRTHFNEDFRLVLPEDIKVLRRVGFGKEHSGNPWQALDQVVVPLDSIKPVDRRKGWPVDRLTEYNQERFDGIVSAGWDLIVVDEAHRLGGSTAQVARHRLGKGLSEAAPYLLLLSATPHQGKRDAFQRLMSLLDDQAFPDEESITKERVHPYVIRTEKRQAIDAQGKPLFLPRTTHLEPISWDGSGTSQQALYDAVTEYVRWGHNQALREEKSYIGFLMILMQRLVTSSTRAIRTTLEKRLAILGDETPVDRQPLLFPLDPEEWDDMTGQEQLDAVLETRIRAMKNERQEVERLLALARQTEAAGPDAKARALLEWIHRLQQEEAEPELKVLVFTEFVPTQEMLCQFLEQRGFKVARLNGSMDMDERRKAQDEFAGDVRFLVSTEAGGEGLNLQFCHVVVNFDMPWNPMRLEQRIGRVDRIGQTKAVRALNFLLSDTVEFRVREVLEAKLAVILEEFGVDKTSDVLDSAESERLFDELYIDAILHPDRIGDKVETAVKAVGQHLREAQDGRSLLGGSEGMDAADARRVLDHPLHSWVERMTVSYLKAHGGSARKDKGAWHLRWPDGAETPRAVFSAADAARHPGAERLALENPRVRGLCASLPRFAEGQPVACVRMPGLPSDLRGTWSLWRISVQSPAWNRQRMMPLFVTDTGRVFAPTARAIWDRLLVEDVASVSYMTGDAAERVLAGLRDEAERTGRPIYEDLLRQHRQRLDRERERGEYAFGARRRALSRIGLPAVRDHHLALLQVERENWQRQMDQSDSIIPQLVPVLVLWIEGRGDG